MSSVIFSASSLRSLRYLLPSLPTLSGPTRLPLTSPQIQQRTSLESGDAGSAENSLSAMGDPLQIQDAMAEESAPRRDVHLA